MQYALPRSFYLTLFLIFIAANISVYQTILAPRVLEVTVFEVGKADGKDGATLVRAPSGASILIDTGSDASILRALGMTLPMWQRRIDEIILTSSAARSAGGLPEVQNRYHVSNVMRIGNLSTPYGSLLTFDDVHIEIFAHATFSISYGATSLDISSSTSKGVYTSNGKTIIKTR